VQAGRGSRMITGSRLRSCWWWQLGRTAPRLPWRELRKRASATKELGELTLCLFVDTTCQDFNGGKAVVDYKIFLAEIPVMGRAFVFVVREASKRDPSGC